MPRRRNRSIWITLIIIALLLATAYASKPTDKACIIAAVEDVWGTRTPDKYKFPEYYEQFMDHTSKMVIVDDWTFVKRIRYKFGTEYEVVGYGVFSRVFLLPKHGS